MDNRLIQMLMLAPVCSLVRVAWLRRNGERIPRPVLISAMILSAVCGVVCFAFSVDKYPIHISVAVSLLGGVLGHELLVLLTKAMKKTIARWIGGNGNGNGHEDA